MMKTELTILTFVLVCGCTQLEFGGSVQEYGTQTRVTISPDWSACPSAAYSKPDSLDLFLQLIMSTEHGWLCCDSSGIRTSDSLILTNGEWNVVAVNRKAENITLSGVDVFLTGQYAYAKNIMGMIDTVSSASVISMRGPVDPNPGMPYYKEVSGIVCGYLNTDVNGTRSNDLRVPMEDMSSPVTFCLKTAVEGDVTIESMLGEVSGVPGTINFMNREAVAGRTGKTMFRIEPSAPDDSTAWAGSTGVVGIVPSVDGDATVGDGILSVSVTVKTGGHRMLFIASLNLKTLLEEQPMLQLTDRSGVYRRMAYGPVVFNIPSTLRLTPDGVAPGSSVSGVAEWVNQAKIDVGV